MARFHSFRITSIKEISKNLGEIQAMAARLKALGAAVDDDFIMSIILNALPPSFSQFKTSWNLFNTEQRELNKLISCILHVVSGSCKHESYQRATICRSETHTTIQMVEETK